MCACMMYIRNDFVLLPYIALFLNTELLDVGLAEKHLGS